MPPKAAPVRVGQQLGLHERHAHASGGHLVLAKRDPGAPQPRVAQAVVHEQDEQRPSPSAIQYHGLRSSGLNGSMLGKSILSIGVMP